MGLRDGWDRKKLRKFFISFWLLFLLCLLYLCSSFLINGNLLSPTLRIGSTVQDRKQHQTSILLVYFRFGCIGQSVVFRLSLSLLALFVIMFIIMLFRARLSMIINEGCFCLKYLLVVGAMIGFLWVNDQIFYNFAEFCKWASILYMALQSIILIDLFYLAGIKLVRNYD